jgi:hypothetical protein
MQFDPESDTYDIDFFNYMWELVKIFNFTLIYAIANLGRGVLSIL